ncbi:MAG: YcaQ family DNA glycosylase, partial [Pseudonocardia sp.]|nr:YcaQ family DNA glycosylase [Pseudonocardia sp.]
RPPGVGWWQRSDVKRVCEWMFGMGLLTTGTRVHFQRLYDLPERVLPPEVLSAPAPPPEEAARRLVQQAAVTLGVATEPDLRDYYRLGPEASRQAVIELVETGEIEPIAVRGWRVPAYRVPGARMPRRITGRALLCPFDPLIWERARTERIFGFRYRIEIYVPEPKREYGYYVFPFLLDDELVARVDLKADRAAGVLRVQGAFAEPEADRARVAAELGAELTVVAEWLGLSGVLVAPRGDMAAPLVAAMS